MYASFPLRVPGTVAVTRVATFAMPKSVSRELPSMPIKMFCGETSRCTRFKRSPASSVERVRGVQTLEDVDQDRHHQPRRPLARAGAEQHRKRRSLHVLHHHVVEAVFGAEIDDRYDVRVVQPRRDPCLVVEHGHEARVVRQVGVEHLDREQALKAGFPGAARQIDDAHAAARELADHVVDADPPRGSALRSPVEPTRLQRLCHQKLPRKPIAALPGAPRTSTRTARRLRSPSARRPTSR